MSCYFFYNAQLVHVLDAQEFLPDLAVQKEISFSEYLDSGAPHVPMHLSKLEPRLLFAVQMARRFWNMCVYQSSGYTPSVVVLMYTAEQKGTPVTTLCGVCSCPCLK